MPDSNSQSSLLIAGVGNGGVNTVQTIARQWPAGPDRTAVKFAAINTDQRSLAGLKDIEGIHIGAGALKGLGTAGDPRLARQAAEAEIEKLRRLFDGVALAVFAAGLGGGTGSGVTPLLLEEAKRAGVLTLCFAMLPFEFEGARRKEQAERGLQALRDLADGVICLPNQRLAGLIKDKANIQESFRQAETMLATGIQECWRILNHSSLINFDFADLRAFLQNSDGHCVFGCAQGSGEQRISAALEGIQQNVLLNNCRSLAEADAFVICIIGGADLSIGDVEGVVKGILALGRKNALVMTGVGCEPEWRQKIQVTVLAAEKSLLAAGQPLGAHAALRRSPEARPAEPAAAGAADMVQAGLFDTVEQGRFKGVNPTIVDGSNLDIPTFIRRRIPVQKAKIANI